MILNFLNTKAKAFVIFLFSLLSFGIFIISTLLAVLICQSWHNIIIGALLMIAAIPFHAAAKKRPLGYLISYLLNTVGSGFSVAAYYAEKEIALKALEMLFAAIPAAGILVLVYLRLQTFSKTKHVTISVAGVISAAAIIAETVLWIMHGNVLFSFGFFCLWHTVFYLCVFGVSVNHDKRSVLRDVSFGSFGSFVIITVVVAFILSGGDILEGLDISGGEGKSKSKKNVK